jgi:NAD(P)H-nitrite reductase large subunit
MDDGEALRRWVRVGAAGSRRMAQLDAKTELCQCNGVERKAIPALQK